MVHPSIKFKSIDQLFHFIGSRLKAKDNTSLKLHKRQMKMDDGDSDDGWSLLVGGFECCWTCAFLRGDAFIGTCSSS